MGCGGNATLFAALFNGGVAASSLGVEDECCDMFLFRRMSI